MGRRWDVMDDKGANGRWATTGRLFLWGKSAGDVSVARQRAMGATKCCGPGAISPSRACA